MPIKRDNETITLTEKINAFCSWLMDNRNDPEIIKKFFTQRNVFNIINERNKSLVRAVIELYDYWSSSI